MYQSIKKKNKIKAVWVCLFVCVAFSFCELGILSDCRILRIGVYWLFVCFLQTAENCIVLCSTFPTIFFSSMFFVCSYRHICFLFSMLFVAPTLLFSCAAFAIRLFPFLPSQLIQTRLDHIGAIFLLFQVFVPVFPFNPL